MDRPGMPAASSYQSHPYGFNPPQPGAPSDDDMLGKSLKDGGGVFLTERRFSPLQPALLCLYPGCDVRCLDEVLLDRHVESHFAGINAVAGGEVLARQHSIHVSSYLCGAPALHESFPTFDLTSPSRGMSMGGFGKPAKELKEKFHCEESGCGKSFTRAADLERHAKAHQLGPREYECPAPGCSRKGSQGFTRRDKLADHWKCKHLGGLGDMATWMV